MAGKATKKVFKKYHFDGSVRPCPPPPPLPRCLPALHHRLTQTRLKSLMLFTACHLAHYSVAALHEARMSNAAASRGGSGDERVLSKQQGFSTEDTGEPILVRSGLGLDERVVEMCVAVKVTKRNASETLKMVLPSVVLSCLSRAASAHARRTGAVPLPQSLRLHPPLQKGAGLRRRSRAGAAWA